ncbi:uncharacterized protein LOC133908282 [Phragmites australis]|uniref:uncharacterized protein LOC133908282 n=1 Tax=Phragmites australis TaxID=29695 RepID=UPI002D77B03D|nr:uncharacterized protein LOC133908282 [Phragmites australis]
MWDSIVKVLAMIHEDEHNPGRVGGLRKDQNIVQAMSLLIDVKARLITFRNVSEEMDHRFNEVSSELLVYFSCLDPRNSFSKFDVGKNARLTEIYDEYFTIVDRSLIKDQLETFIIHVKRIDDFTVCHDLGSLAVKMVETEKHIAFPLVYRLIELVLILSVATASIERAFSAMHLIKTDLRNKMSDDWLNYLLVRYIEKEIFKGLNCDKIKKSFQVMKDRKMDLPRKPKGSRRA